MRIPMTPIKNAIFVSSAADCEGIHQSLYDPQKPPPTIHLDQVCNCATTDDYNRSYIIEDTEEDAPKILSILDDCEKFIDQHRYSGILIHCTAGISRSPTLVFLYLVRKGEIKNYQEFKQLYPAWFPNMGFQRLFRHYGID